VHCEQQVHLFPEQGQGVQVQRCTLLSIKTGGCPETCNYCAQSSSWSKEVGLKAEKLMGLEEVYEVSHLSKSLLACDVRGSKQREGGGVNGILLDWPVDSIR